MALSLCALPAAPSLGQQGNETTSAGVQATAQPIRLKGFIPPVMSMHRTEDEVTLDNGVRYVTLIPGGGTDIVQGCFIAFELNAFTPTGELLYSSREPGNKHASTMIPGGELWPAWEAAMMGMHRGEVRKILVPKELGPGPKGLGPLRGDTDLVLEVGLFAVAPPLDPMVSTKDPGGNRWMDLTAGEGDSFERSGFADCHINVFNDKGELMGSTTAARAPIQAAGDADRYWVRFALGMKRGGTRVIEFDEPEAYRKMRLQEAGLNPVDAKPKRWRMLIDCTTVSAPIAIPTYDPAKMIDLGDGVKILDLVVGEGETYPPAPVPGEAPVEWTATVNYSSWNVEDRSLFDSTRKPGGGPVPYSPGLYPSVWQRGLVGMRKGGKRLMIVPPNIDKGQDFRSIPDDHGFIYEIELVSWEKSIFTIDLNGGGGGELNFSDPTSDQAGDAENNKEPAKK